MTADDAFDRLVEKNALNIPVAKPSAESRVLDKIDRILDGDRADAFGPAGDRADAFRPAGGDTDAVRVLDILDGDDPGDYNPRAYAGEVDAFVTPTETDLDAVEGELVDAHAHGARVLGRDVDANDFFGDLDNESRRGADKDTEIDPSPLPAANSALDKARRLRRFAYLPLAEMEHFETRARDIMTNLASRTPGRASLAVTSAARGAGQAELAIRLALAAAKRVDYRVLLADFDVRKPQVAKRLGLSSKYFTLADVLRESCPLGEALAVSEEDNLYVLPARASDREGDEVLNGKQVRKLMERLHGVFDFVILSCGPVDHADAAIACRHAGATAIAAFCGHSGARSVRAAAERLSEAGANVAGLLLAGAY